MEQSIRVRSAVNADNAIETTFGKFGEMFKEFQEGKGYSEFEEVKIYFDSNMLELDDTTNIELIIDEINHISKRIYMYGVLYESQQMVVQKLEDDFAAWQAERYTIIDNETETVQQKGGASIQKKVARTENAKDKLITYTGGDEFLAFQERTRIENYKLGLVKRVVSALDSFSYKLHAILNYRQIGLQKKL